MTRTEILSAAARIFAQKGFHAASMQDIAEAVNLQKASLYHHVASKQDILLALLDLALDLLIERLEQALASPADPPEQLRRAMRIYLETLAEHADLAGVLLLEYRSLEPPLYRRHIERRDRFEQLWRQIIRQGCAGGLFNTPHPDLAARALLGVLNWTITWYRPSGALSPAAIADQFADLFLKGLETRDQA
jgi:AcrR family transcriptional regulator